MYKIITNKRNLAPTEFKCYVQNVVRKLSINYIVENYKIKKNEYNQIIGACIKYKEKNVPVTGTNE